MLVSLYVGCACPAADEVCVFISVHVHRHALAVLQNCREALVTLLFWTGCFQPLVLAVIQQSGLSVCSPPSLTLASGDKTVNLAHSALMTSLMVWGNSQLYSCDVIAGVVWMLHCSSGLKRMYVQLSMCVSYIFKVRMGRVSVCHHSNLFPVTHKLPGWVEVVWGVWG